MNRECLLCHRVRVPVATLQMPHGVRLPHLKSAQLMSVSTHHRHDISGLGIAGHLTHAALL